jgi:alpha-mannosidase
LTNHSGATIKNLIPLRRTPWYLEKLFFLLNKFHVSFRSVNIYHTVYFTVNERARAVAARNGCGMLLRMVALLALCSVPALRVCLGLQLLTPAKTFLDANDAREPADRLWIIPHTHWEGAVFKTREEYLEEGLPNILQALNLLRSFPDYRFVLDQAAYLKPFLDRYPEEAGEFRKFIADGRLQIVGGNDVMLDVNIPSGESWIRQVLYGKGYYRRVLNVDVTTGWALDTFGHHAQMPQLLKLAGYQSYWFQRGVRDNNVPSEFIWTGLDGTQIPAFWLPFGYGLFYPAPNNILEFNSYADDIWAALGKYSHFPDRVAMAGADVVSPERALPELVQKFDSQRDAPFRLTFGLPADFERVVAKRTDRPVIGGELNPVFQGVYSGRIELKQWMREDERILGEAEKVAALAQVVGAPADEEKHWRESRWQAWEPVLFNQAHDLTSGTMVDKVYEDTIQHYQSSKELASGLVEDGLEAVSARIDTRSNDADGIALLVLNTLGWTRSDVAQAEVGFSEGGVTSVVLRGPDGAEEPVQLIDVSRYGDGGIRHAQVIFIARDVPATGWATYYLIPKHEGFDKDISAAGKIHDRLHAATTMHVDSSSIENQFYRATFDLWTGAMTGLELKSSEGAWQVLGNRAANIVSCEQDGGDFWELYGNLNGGRLTAMTRTQALPESDRSRFSNEWVGGSGKTSVGPVFSEFAIEHPFGDNKFSTRVRLYAGIERIDFQTKITNNDKFVRYRLLFPISVHMGRRFDEIPFGAIERPERHEFPAQKWFDYSDGKHGVALLNIGLPGSNVIDDTMLLSLMRSARINSYGYIGGYEPGTSSDLGLELNQERTFQYALVPHTGNWQSARIFRAAQEFNTPLVVRPVAQHAGTLHAKWGFLDLSNGDVVLSALMPAEDGKGLIVRLYEAAGRPVEGARLHFTSSVGAVSEVNLMEDPLASMGVDNNSLHFNLRPFEIKTFRVQLGSQAP